MLTCVDAIGSVLASCVAPFRIATSCDVTIDAYAPAQRAESRELRCAGECRVCKLTGGVTENLQRMYLTAVTCGLVPPGRLAEDLRAAE